jgi:hypothetical protein
MPRKIKVVDIEQTKVEKEIKTDIPNEPIPSDIKEPEVVIEDVQPIVVEDTPEEEAIKTEDEITITGNQKELKENKQQTATCDYCGKIMLLKNLKYAHPKVCKNRPRPPSPPPPPPPSIIIERVVVNTPSKSETHENVKPQIIERPKTLEEQYQEHKMNKADLRKQRIKSLIANAF